MINSKNLKNLYIYFNILLIFIKLLTVLDGRTGSSFFIFWSSPFLIFMPFASMLSIKSYQSFAFVLLIYFMSSSLRVFGITPYIYDLLELILIVLFFILSIFAPKIIRKKM